MPGCAVYLARLHIIKAIRCAEKVLGCVERIVQSSGEAEKT